MSGSTKNKQGKADLGSPAPQGQLLLDGGAEVSENDARPPREIGTDNINICVTIRIDDTLVQSQSEQKIPTKNHRRSQGTWPTNSCSYKSAT